MNSVDFFEVIGFIDDKYVLEARTYKKPVKSIRKMLFTGGAVACLILFLCLGWILSPNIMNVPSNIISEKESATDNKDTKKSNNEKAMSNEVMNNLNEYFSEHDFPDWFGDYYMENNEVYVGLVDLSSDNKLQVQTWAKSEDIIFKKAKYSYNYLTDVMNNISNDIENGKLTYIDNIWLDSKSNQIKVITNNEITKAEKKILNSYDKEWGGDIFDVNSDK